MFDKSLEFEKKRAEPVRYNRDLYIKTVAAMQKIDAIRTRREKAFIQNRLKEAKRKNKDILERELMKNVELISNPLLKYELKEKKKRVFEQVVNENKKSQLQRELLGESGPKKKEAMAEEDDLIDESD